MDLHQGDAHQGRGPSGEEAPPGVILFEYPVDQDSGGARRVRTCKTRIWLEHPRLLEPSGPRPSERDVARVRNYPQDHQITGTGLHQLGYHWPRPTLPKLE